ncbi:MAG TPA: hypothetical protein VLR26_00910 [Frankiaceae bacterium]|nr:hypothetical protein [Frankiaceae bacterium]
MPTRRAAFPWAATALALASLLLFGGLLAGLANRNVLDSSRFADHVDQVRRDPAVARQIGLRMTNRLLAVAPDLVAVRPLVEAAATSLASSPAFSPVIRSATTELHRAFTDESADQVALRLADVGAVLAGVVQTISPDAAGRIPVDSTSRSTGSEIGVLRRERSG